MPAMSSRLRPEHEIIRNTPWGDIPAWKYATLTCGDVGAYSEYLRTVRSDAVDTLTRIADAHVRADALDEREANLSVRERALEDGTLKLHHMIDRAAAMIDALEQRRADQEVLPLPPTEEPAEIPADLPSGEEPELIEDEEMQQDEPGGELHVVHAKDPELAEPPEEHETDASTGILPKELDRGAPPELGTEPTIEDPPRAQVPQPTAISLNAEDD
jgi:hypothetical protein